MISDTISITPIGQKGRRRGKRYNRGVETCRSRLTPYSFGGTNMTPPQTKLPRLDFTYAQPFKIDGVYCKLIQLTRGKFAIVDAADYEAMFKWSWYAKLRSDKKSFYAARSSPRINGRQSTIRMHFEITGHKQTDHHNRNSLDNRRKNLRECTSSQNEANRAKNANNTSGYKGVSFHKRTGKWQAQICFRRKVIFLGLFDTPHAAHLAYQKKSLELQGEFARFE